MPDLTHEALVERVAMAISQLPDDLWGQMKGEVRRECLDKARAAISIIAEALRGPTGAMMDEYRRSFISSDRFDGTVVWLRQIAASPLHGAKDNE